MNAPQTFEGAQVWDLIQRTHRQLRLGFNGPVGLDFTAVFRMGDAMGVPDGVLAEFLPECERALMTALRKAAGEDQEEAADGE